MVCTETYHRRVKGDEQPGQGRGVVWEAGIIRQILYDAGAVGDKFVPVLFSDTTPEQIPRTIRGGTHYVVDTEDPVRVGQNTVYRTVVKNQGSGADKAARIVATLPEGLAYVASSGATRADVDGRKVTFAPLAELAPGKVAGWYA